MENDNKRSRIVNMNDVVNNINEAEEELINALSSSQPEQRPAQRTSSARSTSSSTGIRMTPRSASGQRYRSSSDSSSRPRRTSESNPQEARLSSKTTERAPRSASSSRSGAAGRSGSASRAQSSGTSARKRSSSGEEFKSTSSARNTAANRKYSDIIDERKNRPSDPDRSSRSSSNARTAKKSGKGFKKFILIYAIALVVIIAGICIWLRAYLADYESVQPVYIISSFVKDNFSSAEKADSYIRSNADVLDILDTPEAFADAFSEYISDKSVSFVEDSELSRPDSPVYNLAANGIKVGTVYLAQTGEKSKFNFDSYKVDRVELTSKFPAVRSYSILAPEDSKVYVNGHLLTENLITSVGIPEVLKNSVDFIEEVPEFVTYTVNVVAEPDVSGTDPNGSELHFSGSEGIYAAGCEADQEFIDSVSHLVERGIEVWGLYFIYMDHNLSLYVMKGSDIYAYIFGSDEYDRIDPYLYNWEYIDSYEFSTLEADNYILYCDDCFSVDVKYQLDIEFTRDDLHDDNQNIDATWVWVRDEDSWSISDVIYH